MNKSFLLSLMLLLFGSISALAISEETPPASCGNGLVVGITCQGKYCDNIKPICGKLHYMIYDIQWSKFVSEEGRAVASCNIPNPFERADWPAGEPAFITGFSCNGDYCDNVALECVALRYDHPGNECKWTSWVSEETPTLRFPRGFAAIGMKCKGRYCDDKSFFICPIRRRP